MVTKFYHNIHVYWFGGLRISFCRNDEIDPCAKWNFKLGRLYLSWWGRVVA